MKTSVELEGPVVERPIEDVFVFLSDLENSPRWGRTKKTVKDPDSPDGVGARYREEAKILGEKVNHESEISAFDPPHEFSYTNQFESGAIERTRIKLETVEAGTRIGLAAEVEIDQTPQVFAPFVAMYVKQRIGTLFTRIEKEFKTPEPSGDGGPVLIALGVILLATAGMRYLMEVLPEGAWSTVLALLAIALVAGGTALILWRIARRGSSESVHAGRGPGEDTS
jgi:hypothetical protein